MFILLHRRRTVPRMNSQRTTIMMRGVLDNDVQILGGAVNRLPFRRSSNPFVMGESPILTVRL